MEGRRRQHLVAARRMLAAATETDIATAWSLVKLAVSYEQRTRGAATPRNA